MITVGIDVGVESIKAVILKDGKIMASAKGESGGAGRNVAAEQLLTEVLSRAGISTTDVNKIAVTGKGKHNVGFADIRVTDPMAACKAANCLVPGATAIVDVGADETLVVTLKGEEIREFVINEKCAAGLGSFMRRMSERLELTAEEMSGLGRPGEASAAVNDGCVVFAELDALSLLNHGKSPKEVAVAVTEAAAIRASTVMNDITLPKWEKVVLAGGLVGNAAFVNALKAHMGIDFVIPAEAEYAAALGSALAAAS